MDQGTRVLVIDDDDQVRTLLQRILTSAGYQVTATADGDEALKSLAEQPFDLVVTDILMPRREGLQVILDIRRDYPHLKIIAISGGSVRVPTVMALDAAVTFGASIVLSKPIDIDELLKAVMQVLHS